jgi:bacterioferritin
MKGDEKVIKYLNSALRSELTAVSQYWLHYRLQEDWGFGRIAAKSREESIEEMHHADRLIERIIFLGGHPNLQKLDALRIGQNLKETLEADLAAEHEARTLYIEARDHCEAVKDFVSKDLFETLIADEEGISTSSRRSWNCSARSGKRITGCFKPNPPTRRRSRTIGHQRSTGAETRPLLRHPERLTLKVVLEIDKIDVAGHDHDPETERDHDHDDADDAFDRDRRPLDAMHGRKVHPRLRRAALVGGTWAVRE